MIDPKLLPNYRAAVIKPRTNLSEHIELPNPLDDITDDDLLRTIVQVDPSTGFPRNDIDIMSDPSTPQVIRDYYLRCQRLVAPSSSSSDNDDVLFEMQQGKYEYTSDYIRRLDAIIDKIDHPEKYQK